jgi:hypothetical protein
LAEIAEAYYSECESIRADLDWTNFWKATAARREELRSLITSIMAIEAATTQGVMIKAQALAAWGRVGFLGMHPDQQKWGASFAADVLRLSEAPA